MSKTTIEQSVRDSLQTYFQDLEGEVPDGAVVNLTVTAGKIGLAVERKE